MQQFSHPHFGKDIRIEQDETEVRVIFVAETTAQACDLFDHLFLQLKSGELKITMSGTPTAITRHG